MMRRLLPSRRLSCAAGLIAGLSLSAALAYATDALVIDKDAIRVQTNLNFGNRMAPLLTLWDPGYTVGIQQMTMYFRTDQNFAWYMGGNQDAKTGQGEFDAGGGTVLMSLSSKPADGKGTLDVNGTITGKGAVPVGAILMWSGAADKLPAGWALCNGEKVGTIQTPDLRGRFIVGYDEANADYNASGKTGGAGMVTLTEQQMPSHVHTGWTDKTPIPIQKGVGNLASMTGTSAGAGLPHAHHFTTDPAGGGQPFDNRPPYYALAYILYTGK